jgi:hypothetical protein
LKLALVGLAGFENYFPYELSGGMQKRAGLARAMALDPDILFFDEPSAGLDPVNSRLLDDLICELRASLGTTVVIVSHELASIFATGTNSIFLDAEARTMIAAGDPRRLLDETRDPRVKQFLTRGNTPPAGETPGGNPRKEKPSFDMKERRNKAIIGAFVLGAVGLVIAGLTLFGTGRLFARHERYILYFDESVTGLITRAPVLFRGVGVGRVAEILLEGDLEELKVLVPIIVEIELERFNIRAPGERTGVSPGPHRQGAAGPAPPAEPSHRTVDGAPGFSPRPAGAA